MTLAPGTRFGSYAVTARIGAGGMGVVYRATDTKLKRDVAIKVLPEAVAADADRLVRFQREAEVLASLSHPNIAVIHGLEERDGARALVMELVEGPTLADRIADGPIPLDEALAIAKQIVEALEAAHEQGIIHRDLKPANVKVRPDGTVKVLDFGLAKVIEPASGISPVSSLSPTITTPAMTHAGIILGTAAYMSPEQARGQSADRRSDIWAFGCVLYEMLAGRRAFEGEDLTETLAAILKTPVDLRRLPEATPRKVRDVLARSLDKNVKQRFQHAGDLRYELSLATSITDTETSEAPARARAWLPAMAAAAVAVALTAIGTGFVVSQLMSEGDLEIVRLTVTPALTEPLRVVVTDPSVAISPDGRFVAYNSGHDNPTGGISVRPLNQLNGSRLAGLAMTVDSPIPSPDSEWLAFDDGGTALRRVPLEGGPPQTIGPLDGALRGASWGADDTIVFATNAPSTGLFRVAAAGGEPDRLTTPGPDEGDHLWPEILPDARGVLFAIVPQGSPANAAIALLDLASREYRVLFRGGSFPKYVPTGHIVYAESGRLRAVPFDLDRLETRGNSKVVLEGARTEANGAAHFGIAVNGSLVYIADTPARVPRGRVVWVSREGEEQAVPSFPEFESPQSPRLSPDGQRVALVVGGEVWVQDLGGRPPVRITGTGGSSPLWTPDGQHVLYRREDSRRNVLSLAADGGGGEPKAVSPEGNFEPRGWDPIGGTMVAVHIDGPQRHIVRWALTAPDAFERVVQTTAYEGAYGTALSPDGRWLAYASDRDGAQQIWVQPFPGPGTARRVSPNGGTEPVWARDGRELYYLEDERLMAVAVDPDRGLTFSPATPLFTRALGPPSELIWRYDVARDGRFLMIRSTEVAAATPPHIVLVQHWTEELKRLVSMD